MDRASTCYVRRPGLNPGNFKMFSLLSGGWKTGTRIDSWCSLAFHYRMKTPWHIIAGDRIVQYIEKYRNLNNRKSWTIESPIWRAKRGPTRRRLKPRSLLCSKPSTTGSTRWLNKGCNGRAQVRVPLSYNRYNNNKKKSFVQTNHSDRNIHMVSTCWLHDAKNDTTWITA